MRRLSRHDLAPNVRFKSDQTAFDSNMLVPKRRPPGPLTKASSIARRDHAAKTTFRHHWLDAPPRSFIDGTTRRQGMP